MIELFWIRRRLSQWGRMTRATGQGYPSMSTTEKARVGRGGVPDGPNLPDDLAAIDWAVTRLDSHHKLVIVECYTKGGDWAEHAARLRMPKPTFFRRKNLAEKRVYSLLQADTETTMLRAS